MIETAGGRVTFDHPEGEHNDLAIAWELSIHGCLRFISRDTGPSIIMSASADADYLQSTKSPAQTVYDNKFADKIRKMGVNITDVKVNGESVNQESD